MFLGIEIGGTKLQLGVGPGDGTIVALERAKVDAAAGAERIRQQMIELVPVLLSRAGLSRADIRAVGIGFGGPVDAERGIVTKSHQIEGWAGFALADWSRRELGWPTVVHNDADTAGLAEACFGAGRGYNPIFYITIGSGIGGGLIIDQKIYRGAGAGAGEIGQMIVPNTLGFLLPNTRAQLGNATFPGTVESFCSGWSIPRKLKECLTAYATTYRRGGNGKHSYNSPDFEDLLSRVNGNIEQITPEVIGQAARERNEQAAGVLQTTCCILGWAVAQMITLLCPRRVIIGGGVSQLGDELLFLPLRLEAARHVFPLFAGSFEIVPAALGEAVVVHGALRLARDMAQATSK